MQYILEADQGGQNCSTQELNRGEGEGYYLWEFTGDEKVLSIDKWEAMPFQAFVSDVVPPESITVYKR